MVSKLEERIMNGNHFFPDGEEPDSEAWELLQRLHWAFMAEYTQVTQQDLMTAFEKWVEAKTFEDLDQLLGQLIGGVQAGMGYLGAATLPDLRAKARYTRISPAGQKEAAPHDVVEMKASA